MIMSYKSGKNDNVKIYVNVCISVYPQNKSPNKIRLIAKFDTTDDCVLIAEELSPLPQIASPPSLYILFSLAPMTSHPASICLCRHSSTDTRFLLNITRKKKGINNNHHNNG